MVPFAAYEALVKELVSLKRDGFVPAVSTEAPAPLPDLPAAVEAAITELGVEPATERHLRKQAWEMKRGGLDDETIAHRISEGEEVPL